MTGTIVRKKDQGYGFITPEDGGKDVFFHAQSLVDINFDDLQEGDSVSFDLENGEKGPAATNVARAEASASAATEEAPAEDADATTL